MIENAHHDDWQDERVSSAAIYLLRTTQQHHVQLSAMADVKANIMITASSILLSVVIGLSSADDGFRPSMVVLAGFTILAMAFAVFSVLPKYRPRRVRVRPGSTGFNLLFFGHFSHLDQQEFVDEVASLTTDYDRMVAAQAKDIYQLGSYLERTKFRFLRHAYLAFLGGFLFGAVTETLDRLV